MEEVEGVVGRTCLRKLASVVGRSPLRKASTCSVMSLEEGVRGAEVQGWVLPTG